MADIKDQLIKDSYNYVLQSDIVEGIVYRIGGSIPVNPKFLSGLTIYSGFTYSNGTEQDGYVLISDSQGNANWFPSTGLTTSGLTYYVSPTLPPGTGYTNGDRWFDTSTGDELVWIIDNPLLPGVWVQPNNGGGGGGSPYSGSGVSNFLTIWNSTYGLTASTIQYDGTQYIIPQISATTINSQNYQGNLVTSITNGDYISITNSIGDITISNTKPDVDVEFNIQDGVSVTGTYPIFNITNEDRGSSQNIFKNIQIDTNTQFIAGSNNDNLNFSGIGITITSGTNNTLIFSAGTSSQPVSGDYLPLSGGTVTGEAIFQSGLTANTISATTYSNLPFSGTVTGNGTSNYLPKWTGSTSLGNSQIYDNGTNIGIGTSSPSAKLDISLTGGTIGVRISGDSSSDMLRITQTGVGNAIIVEDSDNPDSTPFVVDATGKVGIGTTTPSYFLEALSSGGVDAVMVFDGGSSPANANLVSRADTTGKVPALVISDRNNAYGVSTSYYIALDRTSSSLFAGRNDVIYVNNYQDKGHYFVTNNGGSKDTRMTILSTGNVGIGTTTPSQKLHVSGNTFLQGSLTANTISATTYFNLPSLYQLTGGTYSSGTIDFKNTTGGTSFSVTGLSKYFVTGSTPTGVSLNNGDRWFDTNSGIEVVWVTDADGSQWIQPIQGNSTPSITGSGTTNKVTKWSNSSGLTNSIITDNGTSLTIDGNVTITGTTSISGLTTFNTGFTHNSSISVDRYSGEIIRFGGGSTSASLLYYYDSSGNWSSTNANSSSTSTGMLGLGISPDNTTPSSPTTSGILVRGFARLYYGSWTTGDRLYISDSSISQLTNTSPSTTGSIIRIVGYVVDGATNLIYFCPDNTWIEIV
jgi:hypothetical protein